MNTIRIGPIVLRNRVILAPMSGVSDQPFRTIAANCRAGLVVSEMVASEELAKARPDMVRRAAGGHAIRPLAIQLAGREAHWMAEGARVAQDLGANIIDINMGCPARQVTGALSGSALMRDLAHAMTLVEATVAAAKVPVTLKMRLGWDDATINAPELARRAESAGVALITVHGRTRCQFYGGKADWTAIARVRDAVRIPLIANGDSVTVADARTMLARSGADGIMIGRSAYGRPWWPGVIANRLDPGSGIEEPQLPEEAEIVSKHHAAIIEHYGAAHGNRIARKHVGWTIGRLSERGYLRADEAASWRSRMLGTSCNQTVAGFIRDLYRALDVRKAA